MRSATSSGVLSLVLFAVSIHALLAECDAYTTVTAAGETVSIHALLAECDGEDESLAPDDIVSIHALLAECDAGRQVAFRPAHRFNPRTPCGVRLSDIAAAVDSGNVSIHALLAECDRRQVGVQLGTDCFNPRTPCGVRQLDGTYKGGMFKFQSTHSLRSATVRLWLIPRFLYVSIHALLAECDKIVNR